MISISPKREPVRTLQISPQGYFWNFCKAHGRPVDDGVRLVFADGWVWESNRSYASREIAPPTEPGELRKLRTIYWTIRLRELKAERDQFVEQVRVLHEESKRRSAPIALKGYAPNDAGYMRATSFDVDWSFVEKDLEHAQQAVAEAEAELLKIEKEQELLI